MVFGQISWYIFIKKITSIIRWRDINDRNVFGARNLGEDRFDSKVTKIIFFFLSLIISANN